MWMLTNVMIQRISFTSMEDLIAIIMIKVTTFCIGITYISILINHNLQKWGVKMVTEMNIMINR